MHRDETFLLLLLECMNCNPSTWISRNVQKHTAEKRREQGNIIDTHETWNCVSCIYKWCQGPRDLLKMYRYKLQGLLHTDDLIVFFSFLDTHLYYWLPYCRSVTFYLAKMLKCKVRYLVNEAMRPFRSYWHVRLFFAIPFLFRTKTPPFDSFSDVDAKIVVKEAKRLRRRSDLNTRVQSTST
jgi:hypothetical protein